jgi:hypothetical protein
MTANQGNGQQGCTTEEGQDRDQLHYALGGGGDVRRSGAPSSISVPATATATPAIVTITVRLTQAADELRRIHLGLGHSP